jgi:redox-sensitive bicupin YhaK (pirin superfamily)
MVQRMSAGSGVTHSEKNNSSDETVRGLKPSYEDATFSDEEKRGRLRLVASPEGSEGSVTLHTDARLYAGLFNGDERAVVTLDLDRKGYVHLVRGRLTVNGVVLGNVVRASCWAVATLLPLLSLTSHSRYHQLQGCTLPLSKQMVVMRSS